MENENHPVVSLDLADGVRTQQQVQEDGYKLKLVEQALLQRWLVVVLAVGLIIFLYVAFWIFVSSQDYLRGVIKENPHAVFLGTVMGVIPTALMISLIAAVFKSKKDEKSSEDDISTAFSWAAKIASIIKAARPAP